MKLELKRNDPRVEDLLWTGKLQTKEGEKLAILKAVVQREHETLFFDLKDQAELHAPSTFKKFFVSIRAISLTATLTPALVTLMMGAWLEGWDVQFGYFLLSVFALFFLQIAVNVLNDVEDHLKLVDLPGDIGGSGVIQKGWLSAKVLSRFAYSSLCIAIALGMVPLLQHWQILLPIALIALVGTLGYSGMGFRFKYRAMGDLVVFLLCGPLLVTGVSEASFGKISPSIFIAGVIFGLGSVGILHANNLNDLEVDEARGAKTVANQIGFKASKKYLSWIYLTSGVLLVGSATLQLVPVWFAVMPILSLILVVQMLGRVKKAVSPLSPSIATIRFEAAKIHLLIGVSWVVGFLLVQSFHHFNA